MRYRADQEPADELGPLTLAAMPARLRWVEAGQQELHAEQQRWLAEHGYSPMDYVVALLPGGPQ